MHRRELLSLLGGAPAIWPLAAPAQQQPDKVWRIGYLGLGPASSWTNEVEALRRGLRERGYVEGNNIVIEFRWAERPDQTLDLATQLVRMNVDVIFAPASTQVEPARTATKTIPIVFAQHADPVGLCVRSLPARSRHRQASMGYSPDRRTSACARQEGNGRACEDASEGEPVSLRDEDSFGLGDRL